MRTATLQRVEAPKSKRAIIANSLYLTESHTLYYVLPPLLIYNERFPYIVIQKSAHIRATSSLAL